VKFDFIINPKAAKTSANRRIRSGDVDNQGLGKSRPDALAATCWCRRWLILPLD